MTATLVRTPLVGAVGGVSHFRLVSPDTGTNAIRYYLTSKPTGSTLVCLDDVDQTDPIARSKAMLSVDNTGAAFFTPDRTGHYLVEAHEVAVSKHIRTWNDQPVTPDTDNDFVGATVVTLSTGDAAVTGRGAPPLATYYDQTTASADYLVARAVTKTIGATPDTAIVALIVDDAIESRLTGCATLTPAPTPLAQFAAASSDVVGVMATLSKGWPEAISVEPIDLLFNLWTLHLKASASRNVHMASDAARVVSTAMLATFSDCTTRLAALETAYNAHRVDTTKHYASDVNNIFPDIAPAAIDVPTLAYRCWWLWRLMINGSNAILSYSGTVRGFLAGHVGAGTVHGSDTNRCADGNAYTFRDFPATLEGSCDSLSAITAVWNSHVAKTSITAAHAATDTDNVVSASALGFDQVKLVNAIADGFERHVANQSYDTTAKAWVTAPTPYHANTSNVHAPTRATSLATAKDLAVRLIALFVSHINDSVAHHGDLDSPGSAYSLAKNFSSMIRLDAHWYAAQGPNAPLPKRWNLLEGQLIQLGWKLPHLKGYP